MTRNIALAICLLALPALAQRTNGRGPTGGSSSVTYSSLTTYSTVLDLDFTAEATQTITSDTTWTVGGRTWRSDNQANSNGTFAITNGVGLQMSATTSKAWSASGKTAPLFSIHLSDLPGSVTPWTPLRIWVRVATFTSPGNGDAAVFGVTDQNAAGASVNQSIYAAAVQNVSSDRRVALYSSFRSSSVAATSIPQTGSGAWGGYDVLVLTFPYGVAGAVGFAAVGVYDAGWPAVSTLIGIGPVAGAQGYFAFSDPGDTWQISLAAVRSGTAGTYLIVFSHFKVESL